MTNNANKRLDELNKWILHVLIAVIGSLALLMVNDIRGDLKELKTKWGNHAITLENHEQRLRGVESLSTENKKDIKVLNRVYDSNN